ncbi:MAG: universal stress protein [Thaumarchaeota archaeon]|nr:universal stress protein [Nitrososphaerota archaeon]
MTHRSLLVSPADAIAERAKTEDIDLIVIGTRGLSPSRRLFLGSVSSGVVSGADMAVLVVK